MGTVCAFLKREFGDIERAGVQMKWMLAFTLLLQIATLVKLSLD
jgi:hypothetical protein